MAWNKIKTNVTNYLSNTKETEELAALKKEPAALFARSTNDSKFGNIYLFDKFGTSEENTLNLKSEISTYFSENQTPLNDHWALPPITYKISGLIGEVIYTAPKSWADKVNEKLDNYYLSLPSVISPTFSNYMQTALNLTQQIESSAIRYGKIAQQIYSQFNNGEAQILSNQQQVVERLRALRDSRTLVDIYTPYGDLLDMAITDISINQSNGSKYVSNIEISLQQWQTYSTLYRAATKTEKTTFNKIQTENAVNNAPSTQKVTEEVKQTSWLQKSADWLGNLFQKKG